MNDINNGIAQFVAAINACFAKRQEGFSIPNYFTPVEVTKGPKFTKIVCTSGNSRSVYCFVDNATGAIHKAEGWSRPAKGSRGNVFYPETYRGYELDSTRWLYR